MGCKLIVVAQRILVAGLGVTGTAAVRALEGLQESMRPSQIITLDQSNPAATFSQWTEVDLAQVDLLVVSPGWSPSHPLVVAALDRGLEVISEIELAWRQRVSNSHTGQAAPWIAVTGTNGKTTTVEMLASILRADGKNVRAVGNVGSPAVTAALDPALDFLVLELSSFQLHFTKSMAPVAAAVLNLAPDHLDWHGGFAGYRDDKARVFERTKVACVYNVQDQATMEMVQQADVHEGARAVGFTLGAPGRSELGIIEDVLVDRAFHLPFDTPMRHNQAAEVATLGDLSHLCAPGGHVAPHTVANALAAAALARSVGVSAKSVQEGLRSFSSGAHRLVTVGQLETQDGPISFVNDSKATNPHAAGAALASFDEHQVIWIAGGLTKGTDLTQLIRDIKTKLRAVVVIGKDQEHLLQVLNQHAPQIPRVQIDPAGNVMQEAVGQAVRLAQPGDTVLLAPACASQDQFISYQDRGDQFVAQVQQVLLQTR